MTITPPCGKQPGAAPAAAATSALSLKRGPGVVAAPPVPSVLPSGDPVTLSGTARAARGLAASPPVDTAKVADVRAAVTSGNYRVDAERIAAKMIALDLP